MTDEKAKKIVLLIGTFIIAASLVLYFLFSRYDQKIFPSGHIITIAPGLTSNEVARFLKEEKVIRWPFFFSFMAEVSGKSKNMKAGDYVFDSPLPPFKIFKKIVNGDFNIKNKAILIKEGSTVKDIGILLEEKGFFQAEEFWKAAGFDFKYGSTTPLASHDSIFSSASGLIQTKPKDVGYEGFLFPDTYFIPQNASPNGVIEMMVKNFDRKIDSETRRDLAKSKRSFFDILKMASILEKEAVEIEDKKIVAGILWKRMGKGMPLQVDATLQYLTGRNTFNLTTNDLKSDSRYNTYKYKGLPFGPISNPGLDSIKAALYPEESSYWYYVSDGENNIHYSDTFEEHKSKKNQYL